MPPKSLKTTEGVGGRKPMKTALLSAASSTASDELVAGATVVATTAPTATTADTIIDAAVSVSDATTKILEKISRDRSSNELKYLTGLSLLEQKVCLIAQEHLESSFDLERSSGFIAWKKGGGGGGII